MKKIKVAGSYGIDLNKLSELDPVMSIEEGNELMTIFDFNRISIIETVNMLERNLDDIIEFYFFGNYIYASVNREMFKTMVLSKSWCSFSAKMGLINEIVNDLKLLESKEKDEYQNLLSKIMKTRNYFTHGSAKIIGRGVVMLEYHKGDPSKQIVDQNYIEEFEAKFKSTEEITTKIGKRLAVNSTVETPNEDYSDYPVNAIRRNK